MNDVTFTLIVVISLYVFGVAGYHGYTKKHNENNKSDLTHSNSSCPSFTEMSRPYTNDFITRLHLWPGLMNQLDIEEGWKMSESDSVLPSFSMLYFLDLLISCLKTA